MITRNFNTKYFPKEFNGFRLEYDFQPVEKDETPFFIVDLYLLNWKEYEGLVNDRLGRLSFNDWAQEYTLVYEAESVGNVEVFLLAANTIKLLAEYFSVTLPSLGHNIRTQDFFVDGYKKYLVDES